MKQPSFVWTQSNKTGGFLLDDLREKKEKATKLQLKDMSQ